MSEAKHTPGPWAIHHDGKPLFGYWHVRQDPKDWDGQGYQAICTLPATKKGTHYGEMFRANATLIAAAPELLDDGKNLATEIRGVLEAFEHQLRAAIGNTNYQCIADRLRDFDATTAKAEGRNVDVGELYAAQSGARSA